VKYVDSFHIEHAAKVEAECLFEAAVRGLYRLDSSFWTEEDVFDRMDVTVEDYFVPTEIAWLEQDYTPHRGAI